MIRQPNDFRVLGLWPVLSRGLLVGFCAGARAEMVRSEGRTNVSSIFAPAPAPARVIAASPTTASTVFQPAAAAVLQRNLSPTTTSSVSQAAAPEPVHRRTLQPPTTIFSEFKNAPSPFEQSQRRHLSTLNQSANVVQNRDQQSAADAQPTNAVCEQVIPERIAEVPNTAANEQPPKHALRSKPGQLQAPTQLQYYQGTASQLELSEPSQVFQTIV